MVFSGPVTTSPSLKPRLRGVFHQWAFFVSVVAGALLVAMAPTGRATLATAIYAVTVAGLFGVSATYHRVNWRSAATRRWMRRLDHSMIFVLIAGTYTPVCLLALHGAWGWGLLLGVWIGAVVGIALKVAGLERFRRLSGPLYLVLGWLALIAVPQLIHRADLLWLALAGGLLYTVGAVLFALGRPARVAKWFGYHEWWHTFTFAAGVCFFAMNAHLITA